MRSFMEQAIYYNPPLYQLSYPETGVEWSHLESNQGCENQNLTY